MTIPDSRRLVVAASAGLAGSGPLSSEGTTLLCLPPLFAVAHDLDESPGSSPAGAAIDAVRRRWIRSSGVEGMLEAIDAANRELRAAAQPPTCAPFMAALLAGGVVTIARAGDCAAYLVRDRRVRRITDARAPAALGSTEGPMLETRAVPGRAEDVFVLCSRHAEEWISEAELLAVLESSPAPRRAAPVLGARAEGHGMTVAIVLFRLGTLLNLSRAAAA